MRDTPPHLSDDPVRELTNTILFLSKEEAARRQIVEAIRFWHRGDFDFAITLAGAADQMGPRSTESGFEKVLALMPPTITRVEAISNINAARDWLKHSTPRLGPTRCFTFYDSGTYIIFAADKWDLLTTPTVEEFVSLWHFMLDAAAANGDLQKMAERCRALEIGGNANRD